MCGIVGYLGSGQAAPVLLSELRVLEYRGYDSAGVAIIEDGQLMVMKSAGKLSNLESLLDTKKPQATAGIGHTRWATHGSPNDQNAHPHTDCSGTLAIVHNGIIENYEELRDELTAAGHNFVSETDTEVIAHLLEEEYKRTGTMLTAIQAMVNRMRGGYAIGIVSQNHPDKLYAVNQHYSLAVGLGDGECFLASDSVAVRQHTNQILRLEQSEIAEITVSGVNLYTFDLTPVKRNFITTDSNPYIIDKEGYRHFLLKEIHEQPRILRQTFSKYLPHVDQEVNFSPIGDLGKPLDVESRHGGIHLSPTQIKSIDRIQVVACGTAYHAGLVGKYIIEELCGIPVDVEVASEIRSRKLLVGKNTLTIAVSQSGETADTLAAAAEANEKGSMVLGITNRPDSHLARITANLIVTECGVEVSVAATKTFVAQVASFYLLALYLAEIRQSVPPEKLLELKRQLLKVPALQERALTHESLIREGALKYADFKNVVFIGRGVNYPIALEGALKLKELSYIHAIGYAAGELKHGPIAVLDSQVPVITVLVPGSVFEKTLSNAQESKARNARMIAVTCVAEPGASAAESAGCESKSNLSNTFETILPIPAVDEFFSPLVTVIPLQLLSYFIADYLGKDVDQPRNLAKSVTVE